MMWHKCKKRKLFLFAVFFCFTQVHAANAFSWDNIENLKKTVVNIKINVAKYFGEGSSGTFTATGFVVDKTLGLVLTNRHVVDENPAQIQITFYDGSTVFAKQLYYDAWHDFSILQFDVKQATFALTQVELGSYFDLKLGDDVLLIGNNDTEEYSVKEGRVVQLVKNKGDRYSLTLQTSFDRTGGSSGSPVWNQAGKIVAIHFKGNETSSFELPIDYAKDKIVALQQAASMQRGDIGVVLDYISIEDAKHYLKFPDAVVQALRQNKADIKYIPQIKTIIHGYELKQTLQSGDVLTKINGQVVGDDLYAFDKIVDQNVGKTVELELYRFGQKMTALAKVQDAEASKIRRFLLFAGGTFHDLSPRVLHDWNVQNAGVFLSQMENGASLSSVGLGSSNVKDRKASLITAVNGKTIRNLDDFYLAVKDLKTGDPMVLVYNDYYNVAITGIKTITLDNTLTATEMFQYNATTLSWEKLP